ncbi:hypothetical protein X777_16120, partial [Ooceraea biroi]
CAGITTQNDAHRTSGNRHWKDRKKGQMGRDIASACTKNEIKVPRRDERNGRWSR